MNPFSYVLDRLKEPGTMRSLIWVGMSIAGQSVTDDVVASYALLGTMLLGTISAFMPEKKTDVAQVVSTVTQTAEQANTLVQEGRTLIGTLARKLG